MAPKKDDLNPSTNSRRKRSDGLKTIAKVLAAAEAEMNESGYVKFNLDRVIEKSGVARSSVYHHFGGREGLIAALETSNIVHDLGSGLAEMEGLLDQFTSGEEAFQLVALGVRLSGTSKQREIRQRRISSLAAAHSSSAIREMLANTQRNGTQEFTRIIEKLRDKGLCSPVEPVSGLAHLIQSMLVGRILVDIADDPELDAQWEDVTVEALRLLLRPSP